MRASAFDHVLWLGGSPCAGKSSLASLLAQRHKLEIYDCDRHFGAHQQAAEASLQPTLTQLASLSCDEIWMTPVADQVARVCALYREEFAMILDDLTRLPREHRVIAEGAALMPVLLQELGISPTRAIWVTPSAEFQRTHYARRPWVSDVLAGCADPEQAFENWMARDAAFAVQVRGQAHASGYASVMVDGERSVEQVAALVGGQLRLSQSGFEIRTR